MPTIEFDRVHHAYGERVVLDEVSLRLTEHRIGIIGANGSGKSTLARMVNGLVEPTTGTVRFDGLDVARHGREVRRRVGFVFTDPDNQIVMPTVVEDVAFSLRRSRLDTAEKQRRVEEIVERFGLGEHRDHPAHLLSGGQKQLLALASVLVGRPELVVADEPTTLLDARNTRMIADLLRTLDEQVVVVTHDLDLVADFDRVVVIEDGQVRADADPATAVATYRRLVG